MLQVLREKHLGHAATAEQAFDPIVPQNRPWLRDTVAVFSRRRDRTCEPFGGVYGQPIVHRRIVDEQCFQLLTQAGVVAARRGEEGASLLSRPFEGLVKQKRDPSPALNIHHASFAGDRPQDPRRFYASTAAAWRDHLERARTSIASGLVLLLARLH